MISASDKKKAWLLVFNLTVCSSFYDTHIYFPVQLNLLLISFHLAKKMLMLMNGLYMFKFLLKMNMDTVAICICLKAFFAILYLKCFHWSSLLIRDEMDKFLSEPWPDTEKKCNASKFFLGVLYNFWCLADDRIIKKECKCSLYTLLSDAIMIHGFLDWENIQALHYYINRITSGVRSGV